MFDTHKPHPLLAQVPLTVSPFIQIPSAVTLPYTFRTVTTSLPPSVLADGSDDNKSKYVKSSSGHSAHPDDIIKSSQALQEHIVKAASDAKKSIEEWEEGIKARDLAEKRRVAPGWLDRDEKLLQPTVTGKGSGNEQDLLTDGPSEVTAPTMSPSREGEELDRAFGGLNVK